MNKINQNNNLIPPPPITEKRKPFFCQEEGVWYDPRIRGVSVFFFGVEGFGGLVLQAFETFGAQIAGVCSRLDDGSWLNKKNRAKGFVKRIVGVRDFNRIWGDPYTGVPKPDAIASRLRAPLYSDQDINTDKLRDIVRQARPDLIISAGFPHLIPKPILNSARIAALNFHPGLLPDRAGATPVRSAILNGDIEAGLTVHHMTEHFDSGDAVFASRFKVPERSTFGELERAISAYIEQGVGTIMSTIDEDEQRLMSRNLEKSRTKLDPKVTSETASYDWSEPAEIISRKIRALLPRTVIPVNIGGREVGVWDHEAIPLNGTAPGEVQLRHQFPVVTTGAGSILVKTVHDGVRLRRADKMRWPDLS